MLVKQLIKPVRWIESIQMLASKFPPDASSKIFIEMGPKKVLSGLVKRIFATSGREDILIFNTDTPEEMGRINV